MAGIRTVTIHYGPCSLFHTLSYKPQKVVGLRDRLRKLGYRVNLVQVKYENYCMITVCGYEVFRCNIKNLLLNSPYYKDVICRRAIDAVLEATIKFQRARDYLWFWGLLHGEMFKPSELGLKDHYISEIKEMNGNMGKVDDCVTCCKVLTKNNILV